MNWDQIEGNWKRFAGEARKQWARLTDDDLKAVEGDREALIGKIQARYGRARDEARREIEDWADALSRTANRH